MHPFYENRRGMQAGGGTDFHFQPHFHSRFEFSYAKEPITVEVDGITVVIDKTLTPELIEEGNVREIISKIQTMRKDSGFEVTDHIRLAFSGNAEIADIVRRNAEEIKEETLATELLFDTALKFQKSWNVNGMNVEIAVEVN